MIHKKKKRNIQSTKCISPKVALVVMKNDFPERVIICSDVNEAQRKSRGAVNAEKARQVEKYRKMWPTDVRNYDDLVVDGRVGIVHVEIVPISPI